MVYSVWRAARVLYPCAAGVTGCRGVRHDPKGIWPQLLMLQNGVLTLTTERPNLSFWTSSVSKSKTDPTAPPIADGECWFYARMSCDLGVPCKGTGTSGYTGIAEVEPNILLIATPSSRWARSG